MAKKTKKQIIDQAIECKAIDCQMYWTKNGKYIVKSDYRSTNSCINKGESSSGLDSMLQESGSSAMHGVGFPTPSDGSEVRPRTHVSPTYQSHRMVLSLTLCSTVEDPNTVQ